MADSVGVGTKYDGGKPRMDLVPWDAIQVTNAHHGPDDVFAALRVWWSNPQMPCGMVVPEQVLEGVGRVLTFGATKYGPRNWESGIVFSRIYSAVVRHYLAWKRGEHLDPESGLPHEYHLWCNVVFLVTFTARGRTDLDDRPAPPARTEAAGQQVLTVVRGSKEQN